MGETQRIVPKLSEKAFLRLRKKFETDAAIARHFGVSRERIRQIRNRLGIQSRWDIKRELNVTVRTLSKKGVSRYDIAQQLKISIYSVRYALTGH
jgi:transcriptional regulator